MVQIGVIKTSMNFDNTAFLTLHDILFINLDSDIGYGL